MEFQAADSLTYFVLLSFLSYIFKKQKIPPFLNTCMCSYFCFHMSVIVEIGWKELSLDTYWCYIYRIIRVNNSLYKDIIRLICFQLFDLPINTKYMHSLLTTIHQQCLYVILLYNMFPNGSIEDMLKMWIVWMNHQ